MKHACRIVFLPLHSCPQGGRVSPICIGRFRLQWKRRRVEGRGKEGKREKWRKWYLEKYSGVSTVTENKSRLHW